jgi:hypothetical protein
MNELPCFVCNKKLESSWGEPFNDYTNTPHAGTIFTSHGNYGSTVFDPMDAPEDLEITICDTCLVSLRERVYLRIDYREPPKVLPKPTYKKWDPSK